LPLNRRIHPIASIKVSAFCTAFDWSSTSIPVARIQKQQRRHACTSRRFRNQGKNPNSNFGHQTKEHPSSRAGLSQTKIVARSQDDFNRFQNLAAKDLASFFLIPLSLSLQPAQPKLPDRKVR
jgi:hypothetical protein